ncbi:hypothetical protein [Klebsiella sp. BIGb0407]|uniref:hypothetical protein n=1 Tax=Klebsiella sp. BIGb0407 TaxID=2940603 RepID=UPI002169EC8B|nr:hypothetical protein [Klebsiella sp. BIGb0407]MCS3429488.1 hypothetical protein [Klebsiella sp. BIGb0407]
MTINKQPELFIGWDVGGWNCDKNPNSRDAIVIIDRQKHLVGKPWRGNLREVINNTDNARDFILALQSCCSDDNTKTNLSAMLAIDTPLGFSRPFINLLTTGVTADCVGASTANPYLHRQTEFFLFKNGLSPLSPVKDMIGSQATKGLHVLNRYGLQRTSCGVWEDRHNLTAIEAYPSACKDSRLMKEMVTDILEQQIKENFPHQDHCDALICALTGWLYFFSPEKLIQPTVDLDPIEGWIFAPADGIVK